MIGEFGSSNGFSMGTASNAACCLGIKFFAVRVVHHSAWLLCNWKNKQYQCYKGSSYPKNCILPCTKPTDCPPAHMYSCILGILDQSQRCAHPGVSWSHECVLLRDLLKPSEGLCNMPLLHWRPTLFGHFEEGASLTFPLLGGLSVPPPAIGFLVGKVLCRLHLQCFFRQGLHNFKGQKSEDIDYIVVGLAVDDGAKSCPFSKPFTLSECKTCLTTVGPVHVFVFCHVLGSFVSRGQSGQGKKESLRSSTASLLGVYKGQCSMRRI
jgi:hypothetical protein